MVQGLRVHSPALLKVSRRGSLMEKCLQKGVLGKGSEGARVCIYLNIYLFKFQTTIVMLTNAEGRSKLPLCSAVRCVCVAITAQRAGRVNLPSDRRKSTRRELPLNKWMEEGEGSDSVSHNEPEVSVKNKPRI